MQRIVEEERVFLLVRLVLDSSMLCATDCEIASTGYRLVHQLTSGK
jgi:hypothetical protein